MVTTIAVICATEAEPLGEVARELTRGFGERDYDVEFLLGEEVGETLDPGRYVGVVIGAQLVDGDFPMALNGMVRRLRPQLHEMASVFFSVSGGGCDEEEAREQILGFTDRTQWQPVAIASFLEDESSLGDGSKQPCFVSQMKFEALRRRRMGAIDPEDDYDEIEGGSIAQFITAVEEHIHHEPTGRGGRISR